MQANQRKTMEIARTELNQILTDLAKKEVENILKTINTKLGNEHHHQQRQMYASMDPLDIINDLIEICRELCQSKQLELKFSFNEYLFRLFFISKNISCA
jgi:hypothetical protein